MIHYTSFPVVFFFWRSLPHRAEAVESPREQPPRCRLLHHWLPVTASLSGAQEVPPVATAGTGSAVLSVNFATGALSGTVSFSGLSSVATAAHIHEGAAGVNGLIIIPLTGGIGLTSGTWTVPAGTVLTAAQLNALQAGGLYVQIHTQIFPAGEIRGQLASS